MTILEKATELKQKGSPLTTEELVSFLEEKEAKAAKQARKSEKKWAKREAASKVTTTGNCFHNIEEANRKTSLNCLPSSMR